MPKISPKAFTAPPRENAPPAEVPQDWFQELGQMVPETLQLDAVKQQECIGHFERKAGTDSTYTHKELLHASLKVIYIVLKNSDTSRDKKVSLATKIDEGVAKCTLGFHNRVNEAVESMMDPANLDDLLFILRKSIVSNAAIVGVHELGNNVNEMTEVHTFNCFSTIASKLDYGVPAVNDTDIYDGQLAAEEIIAKLQTAFAEKFTLFHILNDLHGQLHGLVTSKGYRGRLDEGYKANNDEGQGYSKFDSSLLKPFIAIHNDDLFIEEDNKDGLTWKIVDIHWGNVNAALLKKLCQEKYFIFTAAEEALLNAMSSDKPFDDLPLESSSLFNNPEELMQALVFFKDMPTARKVELFFRYINHPASVAVLERLEKKPELSKELGSDPRIQHLLLKKAVNENKLDKVIAYVKNGADINPYLHTLIERQKNPVLQWLMNDAAARAMISRDSLHTIAEALIHSKKGRQILLADDRLQSFCPQVLAGKPLEEWMQQARDEKVIRVREGLFPPSNPLVTKFLQHIIYGEQKQADKMLVDHQRIAQLLLTEKAKVKDYSGRKIYGTAVQLALGAVDVAYHHGHEDPNKNEECMFEMLQKWMRLLPDGEALMAHQIAEQFPEGYEEQEQQRIKDDEAALVKVLDAIGRSNNDAECEAALQEFDQYLKPKGVIRTGKHFNEKLQEKAYELYEARYEEFGGRWDSHKNLLAWRKVNGRIQRNYTACLAQAASQGLYSIVYEGEKLQRTLELRGDRGIFYYPLDLNPASRLGVDYAMACLCSARRLAAPTSAGARVYVFETLSDKKRQYCDNLRRGERISAQAGVAQ